MRKFRWWLKRRWKRFLYRRGWRYCPRCRKFSKILWVKVPIFHPDEPPMFFFFQCSNCNAKTPVMPTRLSIEAVQSLGYVDFDDYYKKLEERCGS